MVVRMVLPRARLALSMRMVGSLRVLRMAEAELLIGAGDERLNLK